MSFRPHSPGDLCVSAIVLVALSLAAVTPFSPSSIAQDATGNLEGHISDKTGAVISGATVSLKSLETNAVRTQTTDGDGLYRFVQLGVGRYVLTVEVLRFAPYSQSPIEIRVSETSRADVELAPGSVSESVLVNGTTLEVDTSTNTLGNVVSGQEILDLPLNGRNFAQLGLLQTGVAPLTSGVTTEGGSLRQGQSYAVNGQRPESNNFLLDGAQNVNRMDGGFALKIPVDAIAEFRILTNTAPPEYGTNTGSTTSVVTRAGTNDLHALCMSSSATTRWIRETIFLRELSPSSRINLGRLPEGRSAKTACLRSGTMRAFATGRVSRHLQWSRRRRSKRETSPGSAIR